MFQEKSRFEIDISRTIPDRDLIFRTANIGFVTRIEKKKSEAIGWIGAEISLGLLEIILKYV